MSELLSCVALLALTACATPPAPVALVYQGTSLVPCPGAEGEGTAVYTYPVEDPDGVVLLVHGLGTNAHVWSLPDGGLAAELWHEGFTVYSLDFNGGGECLGATAQSLAEIETSITQVAAALKARHPSLPLWGIGFDIGGTTLARAAAREGSALAGVALFGAPLSFGGASRAFLALLETDSPSFGRVRKRVPPEFATGSTFEEVLLSRSLSPEKWERFYDTATAPIPPGLAADLLSRANTDVPTRSGIIDGLAGRPSLPVLVIIATADGMAPNWQVDPATFGLRRDNITRRYLTKANGTAVEYNHLDMLLHPEAEDDVWEEVVDWLGELAP